MKHKTRSLSKLLFSVLACLCVLSLLTSSTFGTVVPEFTDYETTEVSLSLSVKNKTDQTGFVYNDSMLLGSNQEFSPELAKISVVLATAAYKWENLKSALDQMEYEYPGYTGDTDGKGNWGRAHEVDDNDFVRFVIAARDVDDKRIYLVIVQGTSGSYDWLSDFNIGSGDDHAGFYLAHSEIMAELEDVMAQDGHSPETRIVLATGHSRGAAVSNIVVGELTDGVSQYVSPSHVFGYHFACPNVSRRSAVKNSGYGNIFVFNNKDDLIPAVPLADWGYGTYGVNVDLAFSCMDCMSSHIRAITGQDYAGVEETVTYLTGVFAADFPTATGANNVVQVVLKALALILKGDAADLQELLGLVGISTSPHAIDMLLKIKDLNLDKVTQYFDYVRYACTVLPQYLEETEGMTNAEFQAWFEEHRTELEEMEDAFDFNITSRASLQQLYAVIAVDVLSDLTGLEIDASTVLKITTTVTVVWVYLMTTDGFEGAKTAIYDAHMPPTYVYWINAMYYGYRGWYGYSGSPRAIIPESDAGILTIGAECIAQSSSVTALILPETVRYLGSNVGKNATGLVRVILPGSIACIGTEAFYGCTHLSYLTLTEGLEEIGYSAFYNCKSLTTVTIPAGGVKVQWFAFQGCTALRTVYAADSTMFNPGRFEGSWYENGFFSGANATLIITKDTGRILDFYLKSTATSSEYSHRAGINRIEIEEGITEIGEEAFYSGSDKVQFTEIVLPSTLTKVGPYAFYNNSATSISMPDSAPGLTEIGQYAFYGCPHLTSVSLGEGLTTVEPYTFYGCTALQQITVPASVTGIGSMAFYRCTGLVSLSLTEGLEEIGLYAFYGCTQLKGVTVPASVETIGQMALGYNSSSSVISGFTIYGHGGTAAQTYANANRIRFVDLDTAVCPYGHTWDEGEVTTPPGCVQEGVLTCTCTVCGETKTEPVPAPGHDFVNGICRRCGGLDAQVFADVQPGVYCFDAVRWAMEQGITDGTSETDFSPNATCTRAQIVTMLWRAMGEPGHTGENPFADVSESAWYYDAVLWAVENGITDGTGNGTFSPDASCTRAQVVTFLWRTAGEPAPASAENPFSDVPAGAWYKTAVLWAVNSDPQITNGVSAARFGPGRICTRAQVVTFLYRFLGE